MARVVYTTTIDEGLLKKAKLQAKEKRYEGANKVIEMALEMYFSKQIEEIWEKELLNGSIERLVIRSDKIISENIRNRLERRTFKAPDYSEENLKSKGWTKL